MLPPLLRLIPKGYFEHGMKRDVRPTSLKYPEAALLALTLFAHCATTLEVPYERHRGFLYLER